MARALPSRSRMLRGGLEYLEERYPGISNDAVEYRHEREQDGSEHLILKLVVHGDAPADEQP